jgi:TPP-dependent pyruvate/acetoin dehydrogenase alpha subunit
MKRELTRAQLLDLYYYMRLNRAVEDTMTNLFRQNKIVGGLYSSLGQEAVSVGAAYALEKKDWLAPMIRNIGALLVKGVAPRDIFTQHMAKYTSPTRGKDGTSHFGDFHARRSDSGDDRRGHGGPLPGAEDCGDDLDRRRRKLDGRIS